MNRRAGRLIVLLALVLAGVPALVRGQTVPEKQVKVYLMTFGPGAEAWEKFGHNAIWISDTPAGPQLAYNYGLFEFVFPDFFIRFIQGDLHYWMEGWPAGPTLDQYVGEGRDVWVDELNLSPQQALDLKLRLETNALEANKFYSYDYYKDNCSTRVRDMIDRVVGGAVRSKLSAEPTGTTYRYHTRRLMQPDLILYTAIDFILGDAIDRPISAWDESFLPVRFRQHLLQTNITDDAGQSVPVVKRSVQVGVSSRFVEFERPPTWFGWFLATGLGTGAIFVALGTLAARRPSIWVRLIPMLLALPIYAVLAAGGTLSAWTWVFSSHWAAYRNENLLQASPLLWPMLVLWPTAWLGRLERATTIYAVGLACLSALGVLLKVLPTFDQVNGQMLALLVPIHVGLAASLVIFSRNKTRPQTPAIQPAGTGQEAV